MEPAEVITKDDLDAYADGELSPERTALVAAYVTLHPEAAARVAEVRALNRLLRARVEPPIPGGMVDLVQALADALERRQAEPDPEP